MTSLSLLVMPLLMQPSTLLAFLAGAAHCSHTELVTNTSPAGYIPASAGFLDYALPGARLTLHIAELHKALVSPLLQLIQVLLQGGSPFHSAHLFTPSGTISRPCQGTLDPLIHVTYKDIKQHWARIDPWMSPLVTDCQFKMKLLTAMCCTNAKEFSISLLF